MNQEIYKHSYKAKGQSLASLSVYNVGFQKCQNSFGWGPGVRDHFLIHHIVSGNGIYTFSGNTYTLKKGDTFMAYPNSTISYSADEYDPWEYYWVGFNGGDARLLLELTDFSLENPIIHTDFGDSLMELMLNIYEARGGRDFEMVRMTGGLYSVLALLMEKASPQIRKSYDSNVDCLRRATDFIANNFSRSIMVSDIAKSVGVSRSGLYRVFMHEMNISPMKYLMDFRIKHACTLLKRTDLNIESVAYSVGYEDQLYFSRVFKKTMGITPSCYAKENTNILK